MKFDKSKFEKHVKNVIAEETKKLLKKKGVKNVKQIGTKNGLPIFEGDITSDGPFTSGGLTRNIDIRDSDV